MLTGYIAIVGNIGGAASSCAIITATKNPSENKIANIQKHCVYTRQNSRTITQPDSVYL